MDISIGIISAILAGVILTFVRSWVNGVQKRIDNKQDKSECLIRYQNLEGKIDDLKDNIKETNENVKEIKERVVDIIYEMRKCNDDGR